MKVLVLVIAVLFLSGTILEVFSFEPKYLNEQTKKKKKPILIDPTGTPKKDRVQAINHKPIEVKSELVLAYKQDFRNYWNEKYDITVKVFDKKLNPNPRFDDFGGIVKDPVVKVIALDQKGKVYEIPGNTKYGVWKGQFVFKENLTLPGKYQVNITATSGNLVTKTASEMFLFGLTPNRITTTNSTT